MAPMARALSLSSPRSGFWKPLRTNTTPSMMLLRGTGSPGWSLAVLGLGLDWALGEGLGLCCEGLLELSLLSEVVFCAEEAGEVNRRKGFSLFSIQIQPADRYYSQRRDS